jgi:hypothetical protein
MTKKMWGVGILATAVVVGGGLFWTLPSGAALPPRPITCQTYAAMTHLISLYGGPVTQAPTPGSLTASLGSTFTTSDGRSGQNVDVTGLISQGDVKGIGAVSIQFDSTRSAGGSSIIANKAGTPFPATQRMNFYITVDVNGQQFRSIDPVTLLSTNVTSTPPAVGTTFDLANGVRLESVDKPGEVAMTMQPGQAAVITGHAAG